VHARSRLAAALAAASLVAVPTFAEATGEPAPVRNTHGASDYAGFSLSLPGGGFASASISEYVNDGRKVGFVSVSESSGSRGMSCSAQVDDAQVYFAGNLSSARATSVPLDCTSWDYSNGQSSSTQSTKIVSIAFAGYGPIERGATHSDETCGYGESPCQSIRVDKSRAAKGSVTGLSTPMTGDGHIHLGRYVDAAEPKPADQQ